MKPALLMIDEPTYGLNEVDSAWLVDWISTQSRHCKLWVVLHNQMQARRMGDRIVLIGGGRVLAHQEVTEFFLSPSNEWVEQFIRTGGLTLPAPDARAQDLAEGVPVPPVPSEAARTAIRSIESLSIPEVNQCKTEDASFDMAGSLQVLVAETAIVEHSQDSSNYSLTTSSERRVRVDIPAPSRDGVELASAVGEYLFRDSSAPRGFHWIVPGRLAGCPAPGVSAPIDYDLSLLARVGITCMITLTEVDLDQDALRRHQLTNIHLSVFDREAPSIGQTHMLLVRMQKLIEAGEVLAVHCKAGLGRTGAILAAWLIRDGGLTAQDSMDRLRRIAPGFIQSKAQEDFLHCYESDITQRLI
jgi:atypical dual specificity phosphatase